MELIELIEIGESNKRRLISGRVHGTKRSLHPRGRKITAITAIGASDFVLTGDSKGLRNKPLPVPGEETML